LAKKSFQTMNIPKEHPKEHVNFLDIGYSQFLNFVSSGFIMPVPPEQLAAGFLCLGSVSSRLHKSSKSSGLGKKRWNFTDQTTSKWLLICHCH